MPILDIRNYAPLAVPQLQLPVPKEGPVAIGVSVDLTADGTATLDLSDYMEGTEVFLQLQGLYIDTSKSTNGIVVTVNNNGFSVACNGHQQGFFPVLAPRPTKLTFTRVTGGPPTGAIPVYLLNFPVPFASVWAATA